MPHIINPTMYKKKYKLFTDRIEKTLYESPSTNGFGEDPRHPAHDVSLISIPPPSIKPNNNSITCTCKDHCNTKPKTLWKGSLRLKCIETLGNATNHSNTMPTRGILQLINNRGLKRLRNDAESIFATVEVQVPNDGNQQSQTLTKREDGDNVYNLLIHDTKHRMVMLGLRFESKEQCDQFHEALETLLREIWIMKRCLNMEFNVVEDIISEAVEKVLRIDTVESSVE